MDRDHQSAVNFGLLPGNHSDKDANATLRRSATTAETTGSGADDVTFPLWHVTAFGSMAALVSSLTVAGNLVVVLAFILDRTIRQPTNYFIASLAVSDLLISIPLLACIAGDVPYDRQSSVDGLVRRQ